MKTVTEIKKHTPIERKIKTDIILKNKLRKQLEKKLVRLKSWEQLLKKTKNNRKSKKYHNNIIRYLDTINKLKPITKGRIDDLEKRIKEEIKYSEDEIKQLQEMYKKEYSEMLDAEKLLIKAKQGKLDDKEKLEIAETTLEKYEARSGEEQKGKIVFPKEYLLIKVKKRLKKESKDKKDVEKEINSEEKDRILFDSELKRMIMEKEILK